MFSVKLRRWFRLVPLLIVAWAGLALVMELAMLGPRVRGEAVGGQTWELCRELVVGTVPDGGPDPSLWRNEIGSASLASLEVTAVALLMVLSFAPLIGTLAGRFRRWKIFSLGLGPLTAVSWMPGYWLILLGVWWQIEKWRAPGFADAPGAVAGPMAIERWWQVAQLGVCVALSGVGWFAASVAEALDRAARQPHVRAARIRGLTGAALFYRHVWRGASGDVILGPGKILPVMLGVQLLAEWAFRFPGLGTLAVESARSGRLTGLLGAGWVLTTLVVVIRWLCDLVEAAVVPHPESEVVRR